MAIIGGAMFLVGICTGSFPWAVGLIAGSAALMGIAYRKGEFDAYIG